MAWRRFRKDKLGIAGLGIICVATLVAVLGANIRPDDTPWASRQVLGIKDQRPGFEVTMLALRSGEVKQCSFARKLLLGGCPDDQEFIPVYDWYVQDSATVVVEQFNGHNELVEGTLQKVSVARLLNTATGEGLWFNDVEEHVGEAFSNKQKAILGTG